jgi:hypothetical protein
MKNQWDLVREVGGQKCYRGKLEKRTLKIIYSSLYVDIQL